MHSQTVNLQRYRKLGVLGFLRFPNLIIWIARKPIQNVVLYISKHKLLNFWTHTSAVKKGSRLWRIPVDLKVIRFVSNMSYFTFDPIPIAQL